MHRSIRPLALATAATVVALAATVVTVAPAPASPAAASTTVDWGDLDMSGTTFDGDAPDDDPIHLEVAPIADLAGLEAEVRAVNDPRSPRYGEEATVAEIAKRFVPDASIDAIAATLTDGGGENVSIHETRAFVSVDLTVAEAEALFGVTWGRYSADGASIDSPLSTPVLPAAMEGHVRAVYGAMSVVALPTPSSVASPGPLLSLPSASASSSDAPVVDGGTPTRTGTPDPGACEGMLSSGGLLPNQLQAAYGLDSLYEAGIDGSGVRLAVVDGSRYYASDVQTYRDCIGVDGTPIVDHVIGDPKYDGGTDEASLDLEVISAMAPGLERFDEFMVQSSDPFPAGQFLDYIAAPLDSAATGGQDPDIVSLSYIVCEPAYQEDPMESPALGISEQVLATAAAARITYVVASSDSGSTSCAHYYDDEDTTVAVAYPASSQFVTAVGGTNLTLDTDNSIASSGAWNDNSYPAPYTYPGAGGTGGISSLVERPWWQEGFAPSAAGRGVPDVALFSDARPGWPIFTWAPSLDEHVWTSVGGTSAATPLMASMVALVNQVNAERGQPSLGFLNPLLYSLAATDAGPTGPFLDIVLGTNAVFDGVDVYAAGTGYDYATGLGSVFADRLAAALADPIAPTGESALVARPEPTDPTLVGFLARPVLAGGEAVRYAWDFDGDGTTDEVTDGPDVSHRYADEGVYTAGVVVTTSLARSASFTVMFSTGSRSDGIAPAFTG